MNRNAVRIIGGAWRGRKIEFPELPGLRPTPDRVRETLFNWLQHHIAGASCLDLFAGSGALAFEALSRGAARVTLVEKSVAVARNLETQLARLTHDGADRAEIIAQDAEIWLAGAAMQRFDLIFLDPPFGQNSLARLLPGIAGKSLVKTHGFVYLECERALGAPVLPKGWDLVQSKSAGEVGYHLARVSYRSNS